MNPLPQTAPRRALLAALVGLALAGPAAAGGPSRPEGLCAAAETAWFSCRSASGDGSCVPTRGPTAAIHTSPGG